MSYEQDLQDRAYEVEQQQHKNACIQGWLQILRLYPKLSDHEANYKSVKDYTHPFPITVGGFKLMLDNPRAAATLDMKDRRVQIKESLVEEICDLLRSPSGDGRGGRYSDAALANERKRLHTFTKEQLIVRRDSVVEAQRLQKLSAGQIKEELKASRPVPQARVVLPPEITKAAIHAMTSPQIRKLIRDWTAAVVNDRIFGRS